MVNLYEQLRPSSFRGFNFDITDDSVTLGRRVSTHQFPGKDDPVHEDFGKDVRKFNVQAVIHGADYLNKAFEFEAILDKAGAGTFLHPHYGEIQVVVLSAGRRHTHKSAGDVRFNITFEKDADVVNPVAVNNTSSALSNAADKAFGALELEFIKNFITVQMPDFVLNDAVARIGDITGQLNEALSQGNLLHILAGDIFVIKEISDVKNVSSQVIDLFQRVGNIFKPKSTPAIAVARSDTVDTTLAIKAVNALVSSADFNVLDNHVAETDIQNTRIKNATSLNMLNKVSALSAAVQASKYVGYESREQAIATRDAIANRLLDARDVLGALGWDESWREAGNLLNALSRDINERIGSLPLTIEIKPQGVQSSLQLAHRLYGDDPSRIVENAADIALRNGARHPGFMRAEKLEVLINA